MIYFLYFLYLLIGVASLSAAVVLIYVITDILFVVFLTSAPPIQTDRKYFKKILSCLEIKPTTVIYDLGCGGGNFLLSAAKLNPRRCVGYELSFFHYCSAKLKAGLWGRGKVVILPVDFMKADLSKVDIIYVYLVPSLFSGLVKKFRKELKAGTVVAVKGLPLPELAYDKMIVLDEKRGYFVYLYKF